MNKYEEIKNELKELIKTGHSFIRVMSENLTKDDLPQELYRDYEDWYTKSLCVVRLICPDRLEDFVGLYKADKRKDIYLDNYVISDALKGYFIANCFNLVIRFLNIQTKILVTCLEKFDSKIYEMQTILQADIFDSELDSARHLLKRGFLRAAGAICGVVLEKHFKQVCDKRGLSFSKKDPTIADYNDKLKDNAYDVVEWRRIQRLSDIRNLCDHKKDREPTKEEVEDLISGSEKTIKTIF